MNDSNKISFRVKIAIVLTCTAAVLGGTAFIFQKSLDRPLMELSEGIVEIKKGWGMAHIAQEVFPSSRLHRISFKVHVLATGQSRRLKAGEYELERETIRSLTEKLVAGKVMQYRLTVAEGAWSDDIATLLAASNLGDKEKFHALIRSPGFARSLLGRNAPGLEGYLFPETYFFTRGMTEDEILKVFVHRFREKAAALIESDTKLSAHDVLTLASMVEREAARNEERPLIAAAFLNRLKKRMPLESCVTVEYALGAKKKQLTDDDLQVLSPYNTYKHMGLPPGPVCNPGLASIRAVLSPAVTAALFFVAKGDGGHVFSKTWAEHKQAKRKIRAERRKQKTPGKK